MRFDRRMTIPVLRTILCLLAVLLAFGPSVIVGADHGATAVQRGSMVACAVALVVVAVSVRAPADTDILPPVAVVDPLPWVDPPADTGASSGVARAGTVPVGRGDDGQPVTLDATAGIVVIGHGALAVAVFAAMVVALGRCASEQDEARTVCSDDVRLPDDDRVLPGVVRRAGSGLGSGTAVAVLLDGRGQRVASVVLVPDLGTAPRQDGPTIDVTRYGCTTRSRPGATGRRVAPVLPELGQPDER